MGGVVTVPKGEKLALDGSATLSGRLVVNGEFAATGDIELGTTASVHLQMTEADAVIRVKGKLKSNSESCYNLTAGAVVFDGTSEQSATWLVAHTIVLENKSSTGVIFSNCTVPSLFIHNELKYDWRGSKYVVFKDYDGDGMRDNLDPAPAVSNPLGDTDLNGALGSGDLIKLKKHLLGIITVSEIQSVMYDTTKDDSINILDLIRLKKSIAEN